MRHVGDPSAYSTTAPPTNPFLDAYDLAQTALAEDLHPILAAITATHPRVVGARLTATVRVESFDAAGQEPANSQEYVVDGTVCSDGRFDVQQLTPATREGSPIVLSTRLTFDGNSLLRDSDGAEFGNYFTADYPFFARNFTLNTTAIAPLHQWCRNPFLVPHFEGTPYEVIHDDDTDLTTVRRLRSDGALDFEYTVDGTQPQDHVLAKRVYGSHGMLVEEHTFGAFRRIDDATWRPTEVRSVYHHAPLAGGDGGRRTEVLTRIRAATPLSEAAEQSVPGAPDPTRCWLVWI